jgi:hypothetical protein
MKKAVTLVAALVAAVSTGCSKPLSLAKGVYESESQVSLCSINERPSNFVGKMVRIKTTFLADGHTFSQLKDPDCDVLAGTIIVGNIRGNSGDESYLRFVDDKKKKCIEVSGSDICFVEAIVDIDVMVVRDEDGALNAIIRHVHSYSIDVIQ